MNFHIVLGPNICGHRRNDANDFSSGVTVGSKCLRAQLNMPCLALRPCSNEGSGLKPGGWLGPGIGSGPLATLKGFATLDECIGTNKFVENILGSLTMTPGVFFRHARIMGTDIFRRVRCVHRGNMSHEGPEPG